MFYFKTQAPCRPSLLRRRLTSRTLLKSPPEAHFYWKEQLWKQEKIREPSRQARVPESPVPGRVILYEKLPHPAPSVLELRILGFSPLFLGLEMSPLVIWLLINALLLGQLGRMGK